MKGRSDERVGQKLPEASLFWRGVSRGLFKQGLSAAQVTSGQSSRIW